MKSNIKQMKEDIKTMASNQKIAKQNRKTVNFKGERTMEPNVASWKVLSNKYELRHMYLAYAKLRGRDLSKVEPNSDQCNMKYVDRILENYPEPILVESNQEAA